MNKAEIELFVSSKIRKAAEDAIIEAINDLKNAGHNYDYYFFMKSTTLLKSMKYFKRR